MNTSEGVPSPSNQLREENIKHTEENMLPDFVEHEVPDFVIPDTGPGNDAETNELRNGNDNSSEDIPEVEVMRDAVPENSGNPPLSPNRSIDTAEPQTSLDQTMNDKETLSPIIENNLPSGGDTLPFQSSSRPQASAASLQEGLLNDNAPVSFGTFVTFHHSHGIVCAICSGHLQLEFFSLMFQPFDHHHKLKSQKQDRERENSFLMKPQC